MQTKKDESKSVKAKTFCKFCEKTFSQRGTLNRHIDSVHNGSRIFSCPCFDAVYIYKHHLQRHMDTKHPLSDADREIFICDTCSQECSSKDHLRRHIFSKHMTEIFYECHTCKKKFPRKDVIQKHVSIHMKGDNRRTCTSVCSVCREVFPAVSDILNHFVSDHQLHLIKEEHEFEDSDSFISWKTSIENSFIVHIVDGKSNQLKREGKKFMVVIEVDTIYLCDAVNGVSNFRAQKKLTDFALPR